MSLLIPNQDQKHDGIAGLDANQVPAISLHEITKDFGEVRANDHISLRVKKGTIHGIIGENGAGKSTLVSILYGFYHADSGTIEINGVTKKIDSAKDAIANGICMVHQHFMLVPNFTVLENILLGHKQSGSLNANKEAARAMVSKLEATYGFQIDLDEMVGELPVGQQQQVEILKALYRNARILILDEPTGVLTPQEAIRLFEILNHLRNQGVTILLITHKLREIMKITDYVSVMRGGKMIAHLKTNETNKEDLAELMVGRRVLLNDTSKLRKEFKAEEQRDALKVNHLSLLNKLDFPLLEDISFTIKSGEILGIAGVAGNGQSELLEVLSGIKELSGGEIIALDTIIDHQHPTYPDILRKIGLAHVPEDRHEMGLVLPFEACESAILGYEENGLTPLFKGRLNWLSPQKMVGFCQNIMNKFDVRPSNPHLKGSHFSGGNQQKLIMAREITAKPKILLVGQPTRGVDIGAIEFIHNALINLRNQGCAILLVSVELEEILSLSDRILVLYHGKIMGNIAREDADYKEIGLMMAGVHQSEIGDKLNHSLSA